MHKDLLERRVELQARAIMSTGAGGGQEAPLLLFRPMVQSESAAAEAAVRNAEAERSALQAAYDRARREFKRQDDQVWMERGRCVGEQRGRVRLLPPPLQHNSLLAAKPSVASRIEEQRLLLASMVAEGLEEEKRVRLGRRGWVARALGLPAPPLAPRRSAR